MKYLNAFVTSTLFAVVFLFSLTAAAQPAASSTIVTVEDAVRNALTVGAQAPAFSLKDSSGKLVTSKALLKEGNMVLVFYRGSWCPYCNLYLRNLQKRLAEYCF